MHPINNKNFGSGKIKVFFHDGSNLTSGYVVKQMGTKRYVVSDGITTKTLTLAQTDALAKRLDGTTAIGTLADIAALCTMTLSVAGVTKYIAKLSSASATIVDGATYSWTLGTPAGTVYAIAKSATPLLNTVLPVITGTVQVGQTLTASTGTWTGTPTSFTYQWKAAGTNISGATASTYVPVSGDISKPLTVVVTGVKVGTGNVSATSLPTTAVIA